MSAADFCAAAAAAAVATTADTAADTDAKAPLPHNKREGSSSHFEPEWKPPAEPRSLGGRKEILQW